jgi:hypothetical protein
VVRHADDRVDKGQGRGSNIDILASRSQELPPMSLGAPTGTLRHGVFCCSAFVAAGSASASIAPHLVEEFDHAEGTLRPIVDETHAGLEGLQHATYSPATAFDTQERLHQVTEDFASDLSTADGEATQAAEVSDSGDALDKCMKGALWMIAWDAAWDKDVAH